MFVGKLEQAMVKILHAFVFKRVRVVFCSNILMI